MANTPLFPARPTFDQAKGRRVVQAVACKTCEATHDFNVNTRSGGMADDTIIRKARALGWDFRRGGRDATCPRCIRSGKVVVAVRKLKTEPEAMADALTVPAGSTLERVIDSIKLEAVLDAGAPSFAYLEASLDGSELGRIIDEAPLSERLKPEPEPMTKPAAVAPRSPAREDKRRILDKLNEVYTGEALGYSADWSDGKVAATLSVPKAWVTDLRVEFHGENAGNESTDKEARERKRIVNELRGDIDRIEKTILNALADAEKGIAPLRRRIAALDGGAIA